ncbi:hypothetical protein [Mesonia sp. K7]|uniref:IS1096 element passenger TnpR family protein n=1 Tax=Mesonia sp. K7 TaxID=2218606 RepID=UPI000DA9D739|nr:hypothetical protein [Mesonia sp. K7]PZD78249.1 hypothetical protein DNG35_05995 [Mesonia sp. K7]
MVYKFRVVLDVLDDVFRDIEVLDNINLEDFHNTICQAFGFDGVEMAAFYLSDEDWNQGEEIVLFDMTEGYESKRVMNETYLEDVVSEKNTKLIYVYDFLSMWTFYVELADITEVEDGKSYPNLLYAQGQLPDSPPDKQFEAENLEDDYGDEDDMFDDDFDLDNFDDNYQWN